MSIIIRDRSMSVTNIVSESWFRVLLFSLLFSLLSPLLAASIEQNSVTVTIVVDGKDYAIVVRSYENATHAVTEFCQTFPTMIGVDTGAGCFAAIKGQVDNERRKQRQKNGTTKGNAGSTEQILELMLPQTSFPYTIDDWQLGQSLKAARTMGGTSKARFVISVYAFGHDASLVSMCDGVILGVIELERLPGGKRYFDLSQLAARDPEAAEDWLTRGLAALLPISRHPTCNNGVLVEGGGSKFDAGVIVDSQTNGPLQAMIKRVIPLVSTGAWALVNHHQSHALLGWLDSPQYFTQTPGVTLILSYDGFGNDGSFCLYTASSGSDLKRLISKPISLGQSYIQVANLLPHFWTKTEKDTWEGPCDYHEDPSCQMRLPGILMAYASLGRPRTEWRHGLRRLFLEGVYDRNLLPRQQEKSIALFGIDERGQRDFAATAQSVFEEIVVEEVAEAIALVDGVVAGLVITGGCALNVRANTVLQNRFRLPVYVPSSPGDCGLAIGGAWSVIPPPTRRLQQQQQQRLEYLGAPLWDAKELERLAEQWPHEISAATPKAVATLLVAGRVGAVVRGRQEVGPRALGHRSLLAVPTEKSSCERMNRIKHRAWYRPCAPMLTEESVESIFEVTRRAGRSVTSSPYMSFAPLLQTWAQEKYPGIAHVDGTARPQTVSKLRNEWLHRMLELVGQATGAPILINTSFNTHGKPILNSAEEALRLLVESQDLDFVVIENLLFLKKIE